MGSSVWRFRQQRSDHHRPVHQQRLKQYTLDQDFDMYLFFEFLTDHSRPYEIGTNVKMRIVERGPKKDIERRSQRSKYPNGGRYVWPDYNKNNYVQTLESVV